ncbi:MAG: glycosyltransferase family 4 protein [Phycisphaerae bacterium]|nr:glycosyltransferase family 4 protein [Phycisphaerae bacterium]
MNPQTPPYQLVIRGPVHDREPAFAALCAAVGCMWRGYHIVAFETDTLHLNGPNRQRLRIALITPALYWGGAERWMLDLARATRDRLDWVGCAVDSPLNRDDTMVEHFRAIMPVFEHGRRAVLEAAVRADVLLAWGAIPLADLTDGFRGPVIFTGHGQGAFDRVAVSKAKSGATHFAAVAEAALPPFVAAGIPADQVAVLHNGIDPDRCRPVRSRDQVRAELGLQPHHCAVLYLGRMCPEKAPALVAAAVAKLPPRFRAVFVGDGLDLPNQRAECRRLLGHRALFVDRTEQIGDYYQAADVFALASPAEGFSMAMLEAMYCRLPCALTNVGVLPELERAHGRHWEVIPPAQPDTAARLAAAIRRIDRMPPADLAARLDAAHAIVAGHFTSRHLATRWLDYLERVVAAPTPVARAAPAAV